MNASRNIFRSAAALILLFLIPCVLSKGSSSPSVGSTYATRGRSTLSQNGVRFGGLSSRSTLYTAAGAYIGYRTLRSSFHYYSWRSRRCYSSSDYNCHRNSRVVSSPSVGSRGDYCAYEDDQCGCALGYLDEMISGDCSTALGGGQLGLYCSTCYTKVLDKVLEVLNYCVDEPSFTFQMQQDLQLLRDATGIICNSTDSSGANCIESAGSALRLIDRVDWADSTESASVVKSVCTPCMALVVPRVRALLELGASSAVELGPLVATTAVHKMVCNRDASGQQCFPRLAAQAGIGARYRACKSLACGADGCSSVTLTCPDGTTSTSAADPPSETFGYIGCFQVAPTWGNNMSMKTNLADCAAACSNAGLDYFGFSTAGADCRCSFRLPDLSVPSTCTNDSCPVRSDLPCSKTAGVLALYDSTAWNMAAAAIANAPPESQTEYQCSNALAVQCPVSATPVNCSRYVGCPGCPSTQLYTCPSANGPSLWDLYVNQTLYSSFRDVTTKLLDLVVKQGLEPGTCTGNRCFQRILYDAADALSLFNPSLGSRVRDTASHLCEQASATEMCVDRIRYPSNSTFAATSSTDPKTNILAAADCALSSCTWCSRYLTEMGCCTALAFQLVGLDPLTARCPTPSYCSVSALPISGSVSVRVERDFSWYQTYPFTVQTAMTSDIQRLVFPGSASIQSIMPGSIVANASVSGNSSTVTAADTAQMYITEAMYIVSFPSLFAPPYTAEPIIIDDSSGSNVIGLVLGLVSGCICCICYVFIGVCVYRRSKASKDASTPAEQANPFDPTTGFGAPPMGTQYNYQQGMPVTGMPMAMGGYPSYPGTREMDDPSMAKTEVSTYTNEDRSSRYRVDTETQVYSTVATDATMLTSRTQG
eukprot:TRINITY_DN4581_c0_g1_i1.p1 TRINITY_DN4581_c0_g1~~TRINITY_DN4581_c0_g1_i1.p1  ORF type:complete len:878 (-),score=99.60 TRINITY_DN4581_c0_g1_i1:7-2640(-)